MNILFGGDISFHYLKTYPGDEKVKEITKEVKPLFDRADFRMLNLENVFGEKAYDPVVKSGPNLISSGEFISFIKELNPQVVGMANNHTGDFGEEPIIYTENLLQKAGIAYIGVGKNIDEAYIPYVFEKADIRVSVIAVCENEFGTAGNGRAGSAGFRLEMLSARIRSEKSLGNKIVIFFSRRK